MNEPTKDYYANSITIKDRLRVLKRAKRMAGRLKTGDMAGLARIDKAFALEQQTRDRHEARPLRSALPKKRQRELGILPPLTPVI